MSSGACFAKHARVSRGASETPAFRRGCCTESSTKTWAALAVTVAEGAGGAEGAEGAPRGSDDPPLSRPRP